MPIVSKYYFKVVLDFNNYDNDNNNNTNTNNNNTNNNNDDKFSYFHCKQARSGKEDVGKLYAAHSEEYSTDGSIEFP